MKTRLAVPFNERIIGLPNQGFRTLMQYLWSSNDNSIEVIKLHENDLLKQSNYDAVFLIRDIGISEKHLKRFRENNVFIAGWHDDLHRYMWNYDSRVNAVLRKFEHASLIFLPYYHFFFEHQIYSDFWQKAVHLPWSVPDWIFELSVPWKERKNRILFSGMCARQYPLRRWIHRYIKWSSNPLFVDLDHPGYRSGDLAHNVIGRKYYDLMSQNKGGIVTTAKKPINYTVAKYFEVPACGCLAFMEKTPELAEIGFVDGLNYIEINKWNYKKKSRLIFSQEGHKIAQAGKDLIRAKHTHSVRVKRILTEIKRKISIEE